MVNYVRTYKTRNCKTCSEIFTPAKGPQQYCDSCRSSCSVDGCNSAVRAKGLCNTHAREKHKVIAIELRENGFCGVNECSSKAIAKGYCKLHHSRVFLTGSHGSAMPMQKKQAGIKCSVDNCNKKSQGGGLCVTHYARKQKTGETGTAELLRRAQGEGSITETGYKKIVVNGKYVFEHRHILEKKIGRLLREGENCHHMDGDKLNNHPSNLELWSTYQPSGQRVSDKIKAAIKLMKEYPELLADEGFELANIKSFRWSGNDNATLSQAISGLMACN